MNSEIKTSWDISEYYLGLDDEKFVQDWDFFIKLLKNFIKSYSMKIHTFHTYGDLYEFYQDFEEVLQAYENLRYFLHYKNSLNISDKNVVEKIMELEEISSQFQKELGKLYRKFYKNMTDEMLTSIKQYSEAGGKYAYSMKKFAEDVIFYRNRDDNFFRQKEQIEQKIQSLILLQEQNYASYLEGNTVEESFLEKSLGYYISLIQLRTDLLKYSSFQSVIEQSLEDVSMNVQTVRNFVKILRQYEDMLFVKNISENNRIFSLSDGISFVKRVLHEKYPDASHIFCQALNRGDIDFFPQNYKVPHSFTSVNKGKNPKILLNFHGTHSDILSLIHEFGHAFQMKKSENITLLEMLPSPFMSEFSASFFEKILQDFCQKQYSYYNFSIYIKQHIQNILAKSYQSSVFEIMIYDAYKSHEFSDVSSFKKWLDKAGFAYEHLLSFFVNPHIFSSPFYFTTYLFSYVFAEIFYDEGNYYDFERIISQGGSRSVEEIFINAGIDISDEMLYKKGIEKIFS